MSDLVTGEAVPLELRLAKLPTRALALAIDLALLAIGGILVGVALTLLLPGVDDALGSALALSGLVLLLVGVPVLIETLTRGRSLGKFVFGLRVVRDDGGPVRFRHALTRGLAGVFADFYVTSGAGAVICSLLNERGKRVGDLLAGTVVIRERVPRTAAPLPAVPPQLAGWAATLELSRLPADLALRARGYLSRHAQLSPSIREQLGADLATEVSRVVGPPAPAGTPAWAYLAAVLAERSRRESLRLAQVARTSAVGRQPAPPEPDGRPTQLGTSRPADGRTQEHEQAPQPPPPGAFAPPA